MDTKRAIEILDPERGERFDSIEPVNEACRMAIKALQDQAEREKGCDTCDIVFDSADQLILELKKDGYGNCKFCPKCGRRLK